MTRYAQNGGLTRFDTGSTHEQNPLSGIPIGNNNSVEENETKQNNFIYSNRIYLDENIVSQYNLPKSLTGKSVADATKMIDDKFKGRNDKISQSTKNGMLSKIAEAQEAMKPQEPEMMQQEGVEPQMAGNAPQLGQMAWGGFNENQFDPNDGVGYKFGNNEGGNGYDNSANQSNGSGQNRYISAAQEMARPIANSIYSEGSDVVRDQGIQSVNTIGKGVGSAVGGGTGNKISNGVTAVTGLYEMGDEAFGKSKVDTSGLKSMSGASAGASAGSGALKGASTGAAVGSVVPVIGTAIGAGVGAIVGGVAGFVGGRKDERAQLENNRKYAINQNKQFSDQYALGGELDPPVENREAWNTKKIVNYQPGVTSGKKGNSGFYLYSKHQSDPGFNVSRDREFVDQKNMLSLQRTPEWKEYQQSLQTNKSQPVVQFALGGKTNQMGGGGPFPENQTYNSIFNNFGSTDPYIKNIGRPGFNTNGKFIKPPTPTEDDSELAPPQGYYDYKRGDANLDGTVNNGDILKIKPGFGKQVWDGTKTVGKYVNENAGNLARYAPIATNAYQLSQLEKPQHQRLDRLTNRYQPEYVDEAQLQNIAKQSMNNTINAISQSGASQGQNRASILGSQLQRTKAISDAYSQTANQNRATNDRAQTFNLGVDQVNLQQSNSEKDINARDQAAYRNTKREYITGIGEGIGDIGKEQTQKKIIAKTLGYKWDGEYVKNPDGTVVTDPDTGKPMTGERLKELQSTKDKKALGGYLIKNKTK